MAGAEGGIGGPPINWRPFWWAMLGLAVAMVGTIALGVHFGWIH